jgi:hypothetical protein
MVEKNDLIEVLEGILGLGMSCIWYAEIKLESEAKMEHESIPVRYGTLYFIKKIEILCKKSKSIDILFHLNGIKQPISMYDLEFWREATK